MDADTPATLDVARMRVLFNEIGRRFAERDQLAEIAVFGGSALILMFNFREATRDIDYLPVAGNPKDLRLIAEEIGAEAKLPAGWFNDAVRVFVSDNPDYRLIGDFPAAQPGLRVYSASPRYILAMKIMSMRSSLDTSDPLDVWNLVDVCEVKDAEEAKQVVEEYFPGRRIPRRNELVLEDLFEAKHAGADFSRAIGW